MSRLSETARSWWKEDVILNAVCVVMAAGFIALAVANFSWAGNFLTTDSLFITAVCLLMAGIMLISPVMWMRSRGLLKNPFAGGAEAVVDNTPVHFEGTNRLFMSVWGWLLGLTLIEVFLAYIELRLDLMLTILIGLSIIKAALIVAYFMHLRFERLSLVLTLVPMLIICICLLFVFFPDSMRASRLRYRPADVPAPAAPNE